MKSLVIRLVQADDAQDIIEYAFLAAFISIVTYAVVVTIGQDVVTIYTSTENGTSAAAAAAQGAAS